jgi:site-specific DNA recombinase
MQIQRVSEGFKERLVEASQPIKYCLYARKSSEDDERQALSIESQIKEMLQLAQRDGLEIVEIKKESHSAKASGLRPVFNELITDLRADKFDGILSWAPDRLSRNAGDLGSVVDLMDQGKLKEIRTYGQRFINSPNEKFLLMILCSQAKLENDNKSINVKRGLKTRVEMGLWPCPAPTGYLSEKRIDRKGYVMIDPHRGPIIKKMFEKVGNEDWSGRKVFFWLRNEAKLTTQGGKPLTLANVYINLKNSFYTGVFEYPRQSGNWYTGKHQPLITKDLYDRVQAKILADTTTKPNNKDFDYVRLVKCGLCGSGITAMEKIKHQKNGNVHRYVYYACTKTRDRECKLKYMREEELLKQLLGIMDKINLDEAGMREPLEREIARYRKFRSGVLGIDEEEQKKQEEIDIRGYAKYILREGTSLEKRELLSKLKSKLTLKDGMVSLST